MAFTLFYFALFISMAVSAIAVVGKFRSVSAILRHALSVTICS